MPELTDVVSEAVSSQKTRKFPEYVNLLSHDLELLLDLGFALRSIPQDEIVRWFEGNSLVTVKRPHKRKVKYAGQQVNGITKEYKVEIDSRQYSFVVHPEWDKRVVSNDVKVKFTKTYAEGANPERGIRMKSDDHNVLYLLPMIDRLPLRLVSYHFVNCLFKKINGWQPKMLRPEQTQFCDNYVQKRGETGFEQPFEAGQNNWMDVAVNVYNVEKPRKEVRIGLEVAIPKKVI